MVLNPPPVGSMCNIWDRRVVYTRNRDPIANLYGKSPIWYGFYGFALLLPITELYINKHAKWWVLGNMVSGWLRSVEIVNDVRVELGGLRFTQTPVAVASIFLHQIGVWTIYTPQACKHVRGNPGTTWHEPVVSSVNKATARTCDLGYFCLDSAKTQKTHTAHTENVARRGSWCSIQFGHATYDVSQETNKPNLCSNMIPLNWDALLVEPYQGLAS